MGQLVCARLANNGHSVRAFDLAAANFTGLPDEAQEKLRQRRVLRGQLGSLEGIIDDDAGL
ncbi:MAG: hypothetical protein IIA53_10195 [Chloroflexi bacterium]|nr:hypothetical protein [Chloroflexota bacterium]